RVGADHEERRLGILLTQDPQNFRCELTGGSIVEGESDQLAAVVAPARDRHGPGQLNHGLTRDQIVLLVVGDGAPATADAARSLQHFSFALIDHAAARLYVLEPAYGVLARNTAASENM